MKTGIDKDTHPETQTHVQKQGLTDSDLQTNTQTGR